MFYYLFNYLDQQFDILGAGVFRFISFRAGMAAVVSLLITITLGKWIIGLLQKYQMGETVRDLGLAGQMQKQGTPTMGGLMILTAILVPTLLFARLDNVYILLLLLTTVWMGIVGFADDFIKVKKKNKEGLKGKFKIIGQVGLGLIVGLTLYFHPDVMIREYTEAMPIEQALEQQQYTDIKTMLTTVPLARIDSLDYTRVLTFLPDNMQWLPYVLLSIFIVTAVSNGANITDGIDGLAAGSSAIIGIALAVLAYITGNVIYSSYLNFMYIPFSGEVTIFAIAFVGACIGFLWYNSYPAQVFMGDTGSLALGAIIAVISLIIRKELLLPFLCGIFLVENLSVIIQVSWFKYTRKKYGEGRRVFLMSPLHHHYQKKEIPEPKIVSRFWIVGIILSILTVVITLKLR